MEDLYPEEWDTLYYFAEGLSYPTSSKQCFTQTYINNQGNYYLDPVASFLNFGFLIKLFLILF